MAAKDSSHVRIRLVLAVTVVLLLASGVAAARDAREAARADALDHERTAALGYSGTQAVGDVGIFGVMLQFRESVSVERVRPLTRGSSFVHVDSRLFPNLGSACAPGWPLVGHRLPDVRGRRVQPGERLEVAVYLRARAPGTTTSDGIAVTYRQGGRVRTGVVDLGLGSLELRAEPGPSRCGVRVESAWDRAATVKPAEMACHVPQHFDFSDEAQSQPEAGQPRWWNYVAQSAARWGRESGDADLRTAAERVASLTSGGAPVGAVRPAVEALAETCRQRGLPKLP